MLIRGHSATACTYVDRSKKRRGAVLDFWLVLLIGLALQQDEYFFFGYRVRGLCCTHYALVSCVNLTDV
uniref:Uncharacterized protein n=1 Tax=Arundo donax TaxID=35708 RepID=A0A0A9AVI2_ARUDO